MNEYLLTSAIYALAAFVQGVTGFGSALVAIPLLALFLSLPEAVAVSILCGVMLNAQIGWNYRRYADRERLRPLFIGAIPGVAAGVYLLHSIPGNLMKGGMGVFLMLYAVYGLFFERVRLTGISSRWGYLAGFGTGAIGAAFGAGGPPTVVYAALTGWPKDVVKATFAYFFFAVCAASAVAHAASGMWSVKVLSLFAVAAPAAWLGTKVGIRFSGGIGEQTYRKLLFGMLACMGLLMLRSA
ncbi:sulfite exporter TauE/SafE family protein [Desulfovibrio mangrovi]|uniref:sulfite exporter TauE/SafE family protein n=1 Tax=Desulfovibrio mangrovi TaxID=2976983 RepID=UPI00224588C8|nr:sulfite exporter TauE/SafE family protein [Desulfovibrio mangrovi]UZP67791.1 sulfite exporter TauE/SafE family protein [Desulfovibrio mangrovi]